MFKSQFYGLSQQKLFKTVDKRLWMLRGCSWDTRAHVMPKEKPLYWADGANLKSQ